MAVKFLLVPSCTSEVVSEYGPASFRYSMSYPYGRLLQYQQWPIIFSNDALSCMVCSNFEPLSRTNQKNLRLCHQKLIPHPLEYQFWSGRSNLSLEQKNSSSVYSLGVFFDFLELYVFLTLWCFSSFEMFFFTQVIIFDFVGFVFTFEVLFDFCDVIFTLLVFFDFCGI